MLADDMARVQASAAARIVGAAASRALGRQLARWGFKRSPRGHQKLYKVCAECAERRQPSHFYKGANTCRRCVGVKAEAEEVAIQATYTLWQASHPGWPEPAEADLKAWGARQALEPTYVAQRLGIPISRLTPELLDLKREQLTIHRLSKQLKRAKNETIKNSP
jgi:hypothetical protein